MFYFIIIPACRYLFVFEDEYHFKDNPKLKTSCASKLDYIICQSLPFWRGAFTPGRESTEEDQCSVWSLWLMTSTSF
jgi:hypothetical protein